MLDSIFIFSLSRVFFHCFPSLFFFYSFYLYVMNLDDRIKKLPRMMSENLRSIFMLCRSRFYPRLYCHSDPFSLSLFFHFIHWHLLFTNFYTQLMIFPFYSVILFFNWMKQKREERRSWCHSSFSIHFRSILIRSTRQNLLALVQTCHDCLELLIGYIRFICHHLSK